ncbi:uncharacterized protein LAESUDRAFT_321176 [Laetiporus sulphureus 93-53]|uniref:Uncharacterized protein n=1 Tax=Laetiporus sulphureus 93-53 TaxID=1314785 RepID=A0A165D1K1_9APHY|nr:uncharacterized protein LAESUDRAFT_321176 [Laetiporus sulphureus 93-53]KZT03964.1 hypothetical protein LAESUDRAFT_321176 [Laetiporus sulphureus 93-53]
MSTLVLGSIPAGFSPTIVQLIIFCAFSGAGGEAIVSFGQIVISDLVTLRERCVQPNLTRWPLPALICWTAQREKYQGIIMSSSHPALRLDPSLAVSWRGSWHLSATFLSNDSRPRSSLDSLSFNAESLRS